MKRGFLSSGGIGRGVKEKDKQDMIVVPLTKASGYNNGIIPLTKASVVPINVIDSPTTSYAKLVTGEPSRKSVNFCTLIASTGNGADVAILVEFVRAISERFANTVYGFFLGKRWRIPLLIIMSRTLGNLDANFLKEDVGNVSVWVKLHSVPMMAFSEDGLSVLATKLDTPLILDSYTSDMCMQSWGRSSYTKAMIELRAAVKLKDTIVFSSCKVFGHVLAECPKKIVSDVMKNLNNPRQAARGVQVGQKVGFKPTKQVYKPLSNKNNARTFGKKKQAELPRQEVSNSNPFDTLNSIKNDDDLDDDGKPLYKADSTSIADSDSEVEEVFNEIVGFMASTSLKRGSDNGYGTNSLFKQWRKIKRDDDYDPYDDGLYESHDMSKNFLAICNDFDITFRGRKKKEINFNVC
ncbi:hypothetical protein Tco_1401555 [Tanacetum coccineum]